MVPSRVWMAVFYSKCEKGAVVVISYVGYKDVELTWNGTDIRVVMESDTEQLDEVMGGLGVQKKVNLTGTISSVKGDAFGNPSAG